MIIINHRSHSYILESLDGELPHETYNRLWKIIQHHPTNDYLYEQISRISQLWYYKKKFNCRYSEKIEALIKLF